MSRAFVNEDAGQEPEPDYRLPEPDSPLFDGAAALALIRGADQGDTRGAERATGARWGEPRLVPHVEELLQRAEAEDDMRLRQLCRRFIRAAEKLG